MRSRVARCLFAPFLALAVSSSSAVDLESDFDADVESWGTTDPAATVTWQAAVFDDAPQSSSAATTARYSATLLLAVPMASARSTSTSPVEASFTTVPNAAGPGLPREPPSASTISEEPFW